MTEISFEYLNKLASQIITITSLLGGFSIAIIANFLVSETKSPLTNRIMGASIFAACFFLITLFSMTKVLMMTTQGYPREIIIEDLIPFRAIGLFSFIFGIISLLIMISLSGWAKSKRMGIFTTIIGVLTLILILFTTKT